MDYKCAKCPELKISCIPEVVFTTLVTLGHLSLETLIRPPLHKETNYAILLLDRPIDRDWDSGFRDTEFECASRHDQIHLLEIGDLSHLHHLSFDRVGNPHHPSLLDPKGHPVRL